MVATPEKLQEIPQAISGKNKIAVLLMGYGEVESYEDFANYNEQALNLLTAKFAPVPTWMYPPFAKLLAMFDFHEWNHQHGHFISPHNGIFEQQRAGIEAELQKRWGSDVQVFKAFNFCAPFLPAQVIAEIKDQGFDQLLIYPLLVVDSIFTSGIAIEQVNKALDRLNQDPEPWLKGMRYIPSFYNQPAYIDLMAEMVETEIASELGDKYLPSEIGIVLMNHGCPHEAKGFVSGIDESQALYELVRNKLINRYPLISVGWLNHQTPLIKWTQPNAELAALNLIQLGAKAIVFMPIGFATENHETLLDVHHIIHAIERRFSQVSFIQMSCVNEHPSFLKMAAEWANPQIEALLSESALSESAIGPIHHHSSSHSHHHSHHHHSH
ncbi:MULTISPECIES: ferrochelatase [Planktothricoides]|uniref:Ferrochelatase n=2 Tax=Planktothricoides raciborskii TaxID=132608 RepID=A0AAU8JLT1_9CYAN|nr:MULTISPECIES: ferrochelatase [Planktothricoides]KOR34836.1 ferrochelatase [Planktothricoides sp. SR001]MBD2545332.1 ferrochelatase [Planktothricoides raciborskii FACHB-1370]MBD2583243.1 ferrochelatase [Planktothricoides raciborskii FACHB-1261]